MQPEVQRSRQFHNSHLKTACFILLLLLSGFCGISYEILYGRILGNLLGEEFAVSASILLTFMLGIGAGMLFSHRFWRYLWLLEASIGLCAAGVAFGTDIVDQGIHASSSLLGSGLAGTVAICFILLCLPAFLIGCSLPLFAGYLGRVSSEQVFNRAYAVYNCGAAVTALLIEFWLLRTVGLRGATLLIASLNGVVALGLLFGFRDIQAERPASSSKSPPKGRDLLALVLASVASAIFQLVMVKISECVLGPFRETFALVLAVVFFGIAVGSAITGWWRLRFGHLLALCLVGLAWLIGSFDMVARLYAHLYPVLVESYWLCVILKLSTLIVLMGLPALAFGATIPAMLNAPENVARESGYLLFASSMANAAGFLLLAFFLHGAFDYGILLIIIAALAAVSFMVYSGLRSWRLAGVVVLFLAVIGLHQTLWDEKLLYVGYDSFRSTKFLERERAELKTVEKFKGNQDVFAVTWRDDNPYFFINGYISFPLATVHERLVGALSSLFAPRLDKALVLGLGSGASAGPICLLFDHVDAVEINPAVVDNLFRLAQWNFDIESRHSLRKILGDAVNFTKRSEEKYSLILNTVTSPIYFSSSKLYTHDFLQSVRRRLTPDGIYITWVDLRVGDQGMDIILKTLSRSFRNCSVAAINSNYFLLICSQQDILARQLHMVANNRELKDFFYYQKGIPLELLPYSVASARAYDLIGDASVPVNTLDYPALEFAMARLRSSHISGFHGRLSEHMNLADVAGACKSFMPFDPLKLAFHNEMLLPADAAVAKRWKVLVANGVHDFDQRYGRLKMDYMNRLAAALKEHQQQANQRQPLR